MEPKLGKLYGKMGRPPKRPGQIVKHVRLTFNSLEEYNQLMSFEVDERSAFMMEAVEQAEKRRDAAREFTKAADSMLRKHAVYDLATKNDEMKGN